MLLKALLLLVFAVAVTAIVFLVRKIVIQAQSAERFQALSLEHRDESAAVPRQPRVFLRRFWVVPWLLALTVGCWAYYGLHMSLVFDVALAIVVGLLGTQAEGMLAERRRLRIESQLADAIDMIVGSLQAGTGVLSALDQAAQEAPTLLRSQFDEVIGRIRFGDDPQAVFANLMDRVPLETFRLFATALSVHWEVGGSLAPTLASVGRTIRDRIEMSRRMRSMTTQARVSILLVLGVTYFIALMMWRLNPTRVETFVRVPIVQGAIAFTVVMQAVGILWAVRMSRPRF